MSQIKNSIVVKKGGQSLEVSKVFGEFEIKIAGKDTSKTMYFSKENLKSFAQELNDFLAKECD